MYKAHYYPLPSEAVLPGDVAYAIRVPPGAFINANPLPVDERVQLLSNGLFLQASRINDIDFCSAGFHECQYPVSLNAIILDLLF